MEIIAVSAILYWGGNMCMIFSFKRCLYLKKTFKNSTRKRFENDPLLQAEKQLLKSIALWKKAATLAYMTPLWMMLKQWCEYLSTSSI